ncbi:MAG: hypothetical protein ABSF99_05925 [Anaerolineales bacterium]
MGEFLALGVLLVGFRQTDPWGFLGLRQLTDNIMNRQQEGPVETMKGHLVTTEQTGLLYV